MELEAVAQTRIKTQQLVLCESIAAVELHLVVDTLTVAIAQIERIEDRGDTVVALVVGTEGSLDAVHQVITYCIPQDGLGHVLFLLLGGRNGQCIQ